MVDEARRNFPHLRFITADVLTAELGEQFDVICGTAVLHEIDYQDTPRLLDFFERHLAPDGFGWFHENSFFNPVFRFVRQRLIGRYGIPKYGSTEESPFDPERFRMYQKRFRFCERSAEVFVLFQRIHLYLIRTGSDKPYQRLDQWITRLGVPDILKRNVSYIQHIYFSRSVPKSRVLSEPQ